MTRGAGGFGVNQGSASKAQNAAGAAYPKNIEPNRPIFEKPKQEGSALKQAPDGRQTEEEEEYDEEDEYGEDYEQEARPHSKSFVVRLD